MTGDRVMRRLAAILAADVAGYSRLMGRDENGTLARLKAHRTERLEPAITRHGGRLVKLTGDGALVEFPSAVDALGAAIEFQQAMAEANRQQPADTAIVFRIGLHLGDLIVEGDDLYGDGVNVAARLEAEAPPGGIVISGSVHDAVVGRLKAAFEDLGGLALKNIERPVRAYRVQAEGIAAATTVAPSLAVSPPLALPDKPSIAVLPFQNMSGDPDQEYFADGMVEDIITGLSRTRGLFVIARNSSFAYKGKSPDIRQVGRDLGVRYVLEGSVRKAANRIRITGQLIDTANGAHIWADRFDSGHDDLFELQDQVTASVVGAISPVLERAEIDRAQRKVGNLQAYDHYWRGLERLYQFARPATDQAREHFETATTLDRSLALAHASIGLCYVTRKSFFWYSDARDEAVAAERAVRQALAADRSDARVLASSGHALRYVVGLFDEGLACIEEAVRVDPNHAMGWAWRGTTKNILGEPERAIEDIKRALRLSPLDPQMFVALGQLANSYILTGRYDEAVSAATGSLRLRPNHLTALRALMVAHALAGRLDEARSALGLYQSLAPDARLSMLRTAIALRRDEDFAVFREGLRLAGLPE